MNITPWDFFDIDEDDDTPPEPASPGDGYTGTVYWPIDN